MRLSRIFTAIAVGLAVVAVPTAAGAALSQPQPPPNSPQYPPQPPPYPPYPPTGPNLTVTPSTVVVGETVTVTGTGFAPNELVEITITTNPQAAGLGGSDGTGQRLDGSTVAMAPVAYQRRDTSQPGGRPEHKGGLPEHKGGTWDGSTDCTPQSFGIRADAQGSFEFTFRPRCPGEVVITARGLESGRTATAVLTVLKYHHGGGKPGDGKPGGGKLPVTGSSSMDLPLKVGGALVGAGAVMLLGTFLWRRRDRFGSGAAS
ncbi:hypothetical protein [Micromonospora cathayae]|uniref:LPXTG-motif cell wall anchor domain-containing protein n=1 Tax=Micromonospora cathayae TaxID=3028804 RepID=A0ABY7ZJF1_9ACTN|nr:hypothetical protein [Micromonospora sp. HUAS 3]WDZ83076.1 hypothetical protein PVK37_21730 [Micromonospora sp. HUAS 3]